MTVALFVIVIVYTVGTLGFVWWTSHHGLIFDRLRQRVVVTTKAGDTFAGVLFEADRDLCVLREASIIGDGGARVGADGEVLIFRTDVAYIQVL